MRVVITPELFLECLTPMTINAIITDLRRGLLLPEGMTIDDVQFGLTVGSAELHGVTIEGDPEIVQPEYELVSGARRLTGFKCARRVADRNGDVKQ